MDNKTSLLILIGLLVLTILTQGAIVLYGMQSPSSKDCDKNCVSDITNAITLTGLGVSVFIVIMCVYLGFNYIQNETLDPKAFSSIMNSVLITIVIIAITSTITFWSTYHMKETPTTCSCTDEGGKNIQSSFIDFYLPKGQTVNMLYSSSLVSLVGGVLFTIATIVLYIKNTQK